MAKNYGWRDLLNAEEKGLAKPSKNSTWRELLEYEQGGQGSGLSADYFNEAAKQGVDTYNRVATQAGNLAQRYESKGYIDPKRYDAQRGATDRWLKQWQDTFDNLQGLGYDVSSLTGISKGYQQVGSAMDKIDMNRYEGVKDERDYYNKRLQGDIERGEVNPANISTIGPRVAGKAQWRKAADTYKGNPDSIFIEMLRRNQRNQAENEAAKRQRDEQLKKLQPYLPEYPDRPAGQPTTEPMQPERYNAPRPYDPASAPQVELKKEYGVPQSLDPSRRIASAGSTDFSFDRPQNWSSWMEQVQQAATPAPPKTDSLGRKVEDISITGGIIRGNTINNLPAEAQEYYETTTSEGAKARTSRLQAQHDELMAQRNRVFQDISDMDRALGHAPSPQDVEAYRNFVNTKVMRPKAAETLADLDKQLSDLNEQITNTNNQATILELKENYKGFEDDPIATQKFNADMYKAKFGAEWDKMSQLEKVGIIAGDAAKMGMYTAAGGWYALSDIMADVLGMPKNEWSKLNKELRANLQSEMTLQAQKMGPATEAVQAVITATVDTIPAMVMAVLSGGQTTAATATKTLATAGQGLWAGVRQSALEMFKSPNFIFNLLSEGGRGYEEERAKGYSPTEAAVNASLKAFPNAMIEQGGIQSAMQRPNVFKELVRTGLEEGGEEITQGTVGNAYDFIRSGKIMQPDLDDIISWDNPEAVIAGKKMLEEGAMGAAVGGILGGTQAGVRKIGDAVMGGAEPAEVDWGDYWKKIDAEQDAQIAAKQQQEAAAPVTKSVATTVKEVAERLSLDTAAEDKLNADLAASKLDEATFSDAYARAYEAGIEGIDAVYLTASDAVKKLSPDLAKTAYEAGIKAYEGKEKPKILSAAASARMSKLKPGEGSVTMHESVQQAKLAPYQNKQIEIWKTAAKVLGLNAVMFQSATDADGNIVAGTEFGLENGKYEYSTGRIWIDVNAQKKNINDNAQAIILKTAGHELAHFLKHMSPDLYREYSRAVTQALANAGQNIDTLIDEQIARSAAGSGGDISFGVALEEVIANTSDLMLRDSQVINNIRETSPDLFARMHKWVKDFAQRVRDAFERFRGTESVAQKAIMQGVEGVLRYTEDLVAKFDAALGDAAGIVPSVPAEVGKGVPSVQETAKAAAQAKPVIPADAELSEGSDAIPQNGNTGRVFTNDEDAGVRFQERDDNGVLITDKYPNLNLNEDISSLDGVPAIRLIDGSILPAVGAPTHVNFITKNNIDVADVHSGGWISKGIYDPSFTSETSPYIQRELAKRRRDAGRGVLYQERAYAPPMYSKMEQEIEAYKGDKLGADSVVKYLQGRGVKADEIRWSGIVPFLQGKKSVSKAELLEFAKASALRIEDISYEAAAGEPLTPWDRAIGAYAGETKFSQYKNPDGTNYREILFTVPDLDGTFQSAHWDEKNILAHARLQDFQTEDGKPVLFVEEVQSDWHEKGREQGYERSVGEEERKAKLQELYDKHAQMKAEWRRLMADTSTPILKHEHELDTLTASMTSVMDEIGALNNRAQKGIPEAPFATTWHEYVLKRTLRMAAEQGADYMAWTTGQMQLDRYPLEKHINELALKANSDGTYNLVIEGKDGQEIGEYSRSGKKVTASELAGVVGKEYAAKLVDGANKAKGAEWGKQNKNPEFYTIRPSEFSIGGEGMRNFYDIGGKSSQNIPRFLNKYGAQWGAKISEITLKTGDKVPAIEINDAMKESVLYQGQVLYQERDSDNTPLSPEQIEYFKDSKVRDEQGRLLKVYHGTTRVFTEFKTNAPGQTIKDTIGSHFGTEKAANDRLGVVGKGKNPYGESAPNVMAVFLNITNPLLKRGGGIMTESELNACLKRVGKKLNIPDRELGNSSQYSRVPSYVGETIQAYLKERGYDGIPYINSWEDRGNVSYIAFNPEQIKSTTNLTPTASPDIRFQEREQNIAQYEAPKIAEAIRAKRGGFFDAFGIRTGGDQKIGDALPPSQDWDFEKDDWADSTLPGTSATNIAYTFDEELEANILQAWRANAAYGGKKQFIVAGKDMGYGDDPSEVVIGGAEVIYVIDGEKDINIRFQERTDDPTSAREILSTGFEQIAVNDAERSLLKTYQGRVKELNAMEQAVVDARTQIQAIESAEGFDPKAPNDRLIRLKNNAKTLTDKINRADKKLLKFEKAAPLKNVLDREVKKVQERQSEIRRRQLEKYRADRAETSMKQRYRGDISKGVKSLNNMLMNESDKKHIPEGFKAAVIEFLKLFTDNTSVFDYRRLSVLKEMYDALVTSDSELAGMYDFDIAQDIADAAQLLEGKRLSQLTEAELEKMRDVVTHFNHIVKNENQIFTQKRSVKTTDAAEEGLSEYGKKAKEMRLALLNGKNPIAAINKFLTSKNIKPMYFFKRVGGILQELFDDIRAAQGKWAFRMNEDRNFFRNTVSKYNYYKWVDDGQFTFKTARGDQITLTRDQALELYAIDKREKTNKQQGAEHLAVGGFVYEDAVKVKKKSALGVPMAYEIDVGENHPLTDSDLEQIGKWLTNEQRAFADEMVNYLSTTMGERGNEVSLALYGIRKYVEKYYFPYKSANNYLYSHQGGAQDDSAIKHRSFTKRTTVSANNPVVLTGFTKVWADHVQNMNLYNTMAVPLDNFNRVYNYRIRGDKDATKAQSVKAALEAAYGKEANAYIKQLLNDVNGGIRPDKGDAEARKMMSLWKKGAVFASLSVVVQQPSAIGRALALVDAKYFRKGYTKAGYEEMMKWSGTANIKAMGRFDANMGMTAAGWLTQREYTGMDEKAKAFAKDGSFRDDVLSWLPQKADEMTWTALWEAVKRETASKYGNLIGSDAFMQKVAERFDEVIDYTQVYDSVLSRSEVMRSQSALAQMVTAFMAEPTTAYNMLLDSIANRKNKGIKNYVKPGRALGAFAVSVMLNSILKAMVTAGRDDDEKYTYLEKYLRKVSGSIADELNPLGLVPYGRDILSLWEGYDVERADMSLIGDLVNAAKKASKTDTPILQRMDVLAGAIGNALGIPYKNVRRDIQGIYNVLASSAPLAAQSASGAKYSLLEGLPWFDASRAGYARKLYSAIAKGDAQEEAGLREQIGKIVKKDSDINTELRKIITTEFEEERLEPRTALQQMIDLTELKQIKGKIGDWYKDGLIGQDVAEQLLVEFTQDDQPNEIYKKIEEWNYSKNPDNEGESYSTYKPFYEAIDSGKDLRAVVNTYMDPEKYGATKSTLSGRITDNYTEQYIETYKRSKSEAAALKARLLNAYVMLGYDREDRSKTIDKWLEM